MAAKPPALPFAWLGRYWAPVGLGLVTLMAGYMRFFQINTLPPGLDETSARIGLSALGVNFQHPLPPLESYSGYAPLWLWLQSLSVHIFGTTGWALRLWPAVLGTLAVVATWLWLNDWFGRRVAWVGAFTMAVTPWAITISRNGIETALFPLLVPLTLWLSSRALKEPSTARYAQLGAVLALNLLSGPIGWLLTLSVVALAIWRVNKHRKLLPDLKARSVGAAIAGTGVALLALLAGLSFEAVKHLPASLNLATAPATIGQNITKVLLMFNVRGDENYRHNLAGEPLLNAFVGLMMVAGLLVAISRLHRLRYRVLLILTIVMLLPAFLAPAAPNSSWAVGALPLIFALVGIGTGYMLELWYATFPINSAARATGQAAIILLLALSLLQGYTQYFKAWAGSTAVYLAYNEGAQQMAAHVKSDKFNGERFAVLPAEQIPVINYLAHDRHDYTVLTPAGLVSLPVATANRQFYINAASRDESVKTLKAKFPGGVLIPHFSDFNQVEIYYTYEVKK